MLYLKYEDLTLQDIVQHNRLSSAAQTVGSTLKSGATIVLYSTQKIDK